MDLDFEGTGDNKVTQTAPNGNPNTTTVETTPIDGKPEVEDVTAKDGGSVTTTTPPVEENQPTEIPHTLEVGTQIEFDGTNYVVADNGDIVDDKGNVFKQAKDVKAWLDENNTSEAVDNNGELTIDAIRNAVGVDVADENGVPVEFTNDANGVKSYLDSVMNIRTVDIQNAAINKLFADIPILKEFCDYYTINGTGVGFGETPDRSVIELDKNNENQLIAVIKTAAREFGNNSLNDNYIQYLKSSGALYDEAKTQLSNLVKKDQQEKQLREQQAEEIRRLEDENTERYWQAISGAITNRNIAGYKIPESFVKEIDGKKYTLTPNDFFNYIYRKSDTDDNGKPITAYQRDLDKLSDEDIMNRELLDAWLMFTGGTYKDLVDMAVKENDVRKLIVKSKATRTQHTVKINKPNKSKNNIDDIIF